MLVFWVLKKIILENFTLTGTIIADRPILAAPSPIPHLAIPEGEVEEEFIYYFKYRHPHFSHFFMFKHFNFKVII